MRIVKPYATITADSHAHVPLNGMRHIEACARISHRSEDKQTPDSWNRLLQSIVLDHGDWSVVEHVSVTVDALVDRGITHEWVRHRLFSFTQESTRFVNYNKTKDGELVHPPSFIYPKPDVECQLCLYHMNHDPAERSKQRWHGATVCVYESVWIEAIENAESSYRTLLAQGWRPQEARSVLPNALASRIVITGNLRNWRHFFIMRTTAETHPQFRQVSIPLLAEFQAAFPLLFDDIEPLAKQSLSMKRAR